jgi:hypothetical protein
LRRISVEGYEFAAGGVEAGLQALDFAEPPVDAGFLDAVAEVAGDHFQALPLDRVDTQHGTADTGLTEMILVGV